MSLHVATTVIQLVKNNKYWSCKWKDVNVYLHIKWGSEIKTHDAQDAYREALCDQVLTQVGLIRAVHLWTDVNTRCVERASVIAAYRCDAVET